MASRREARCPRARPHVVAFANNKGGVGKSTLAAALAAAHAADNPDDRVLFLDLTATAGPAATLLGGAKAAPAGPVVWPLVRPPGVVRAALAWTLVAVCVTAAALRLLAEGELRLTHVALCAAVGAAACRAALATVAWAKPPDPLATAVASNALPNLLVLGGEPESAAGPRLRAAPAPAGPGLLRRAAAFLCGAAARLVRCTRSRQPAAGPDPATRRRSRWPWASRHASKGVALVVIDVDNVLDAYAHWAARVADAVVVPASTSAADAARLESDPRNGALLPLLHALGTPVAAVIFNRLRCTGAGCGSEFAVSAAEAAARDEVFARLAPRVGPACHIAAVRELPAGMLAESCASGTPLVCLHKCSGVSQETLAAAKDNLRQVAAVVFAPHPRGA